ncbi:MAG TPA: DUF6265 family protein [Ideonella sp.]|nr:DUF6265 family protein [Ideonella sp.]
MAHTRPAPIAASALLLAALLSPAAQAQADALDQLAWLGGCWASEGGEPGSGEQWMAPAGGTLLGMSRTVSKGKTVAHEFMQIRRGDDGRLAFIAQPSGQALTRFPLLRLSATEAVFENPDHDFPQRVIYASGDGKLLRARIEGKVQGVARGIDFPMKRVPCGAPAR